MRGVFTVDGSYKLFDQDWSWNAYAQHTYVREWQYAPYNTLSANFGNAVDADHRDGNRRGLAGRRAEHYALHTRIQRGGGRHSTAERKRWR